MMTLLLTTLALAISAGSLLLGWRSSVNLRSVANTLRNLDTQTRENFESVANTLRNLDTQTRENFESVANTLRRLGEISESSWALANLNSSSWRDYIAVAQMSAQDSTPRYLEPSPTGGSLLTDNGRELLNGSFMRDIVDVIQSEPTGSEIPINRTIIKLGVNSLYYQAQVQRVSLNIMMGVVAAYIDECQRKIREGDSI